MHRNCTKHTSARHARIRKIGSKIARSNSLSVSPSSGGTGEEVTRIAGGSVGSVATGEEVVGLMVGVVVGVVVGTEVVGVVVVGELEGNGDGEVVTCCGRSLGSAVGANVIKLGWLLGVSVGAFVAMVGDAEGKFVAGESVGKLDGDLVRVGRLVVFGAFVVGLVGRLEGLRVFGTG